jgi:hypothetical protein
MVPVVACALAGAMDRRQMWLLIGRFRGSFKCNT